LIFEYKVHYQTSAQRKFSLKKKIKSWRERETILAGARRELGRVYKKPAEKKGGEGPFEGWPP